eukprot:351417_1
MSEQQQLKQWWDSNGLEKSAFPKLVNDLEITSLSELALLPSDDIADAAKELGLKFGKKTKFMKAVLDLKKQPKKEEEKVDEMTQKMAQANIGGYNDGNMYKQKPSGYNDGNMYGKKKKKKIDVHAHAKKNQAMVSCPKCK